MTDEGSRRDQRCFIDRVDNSSRVVQAVHRVNSALLNYVSIYLSLPPAVFSHTPPSGLGSRHRSSFNSRCRSCTRVDWGTRGSETRTFGMQAARASSPVDLFNHWTLFETHVSFKRTDLYSWPEPHWISYENFHRSSFMQRLNGCSS